MKYEIKQQRLTLYPYLLLRVLNPLIFRNKTMSMALSEVPKTKVIQMMSSRIRVMMRSGPSSEPSNRVILKIVSTKVTYCVQYILFITP